MDSETLDLINILLSRNKIFLTDAIVMTKSTQRQVYYRLEKVNDFLAENMQELVSVGENKEFIIKESVRVFLTDYLYDQDHFNNYYLNKEERKHYIFLMLFINQEYVSINHFTVALKVSKSTLLQDLKELSEFLSEDELIIENDRTRGYYLAGSERLIRKHMMNIILEYVSEKHNFRLLNLFVTQHYLETLDSLKGTIEDLAQEYEIVFVEDRLIEFIYIFIMIKSRISNTQSESNLYNDIPIIELMYKFKEYDFTKELLQEYFLEDIEDHEEDIQYLTSWILGISVGDVEESSADLLIIGELVAKILKRFEVVSSIAFEDVETMFRHIYSHFRPAYYRLLFKHPIVNPLTDTIKSEYNDLYKLVAETMRPISESLESEIPHEELAYLTLHFFSAYKEIKKVKQEKMRGLIICLNGVGSSAILYNELNRMFDEIEFYKPLEVSKVNMDEYPADIVFTTHYFKELKELGVPIVKVSPVMDSLLRYQVIQEARIKLGLEQSETQYLEGVLNVVKSHFGKIDNETKFKEDILNVLLVSNKSYEYERHNDGLRLIDMIDKERIILDINANDWKTAIKEVGQILVTDNHVEQGYIDSIISMHDSEISTFVITNRIAMPHTKSEFGAINHVFSIGVLKEEIDFGYKDSKPVKFLFCLSAPDNYRHINAMTDFLDLINDESFIDVLENSKTSEEVYRYILNYDNSRV